MEPCRLIIKKRKTVLPEHDDHLLPLHKTNVNVRERVDLENNSWNKFGNFRRRQPSGRKGKDSGALFGTQLMCRIMVEGPSMRRNQSDSTPSGWSDPGKIKLDSAFTIRLTRISWKKRARMSKCLTKNERCDNAGTVIGG